MAEITVRHYSLWGDLQRTIDERDELREKVAFLQRQVDELSRERDSLQRELHKTQDYAADLEAQVEVLEDEVARLQNRYRLSRFVIRALKENLDKDRKRWEAELHPLARFIQRCLG